mmetsp:Transcript_9027/g.18818  ORF Transcript_9027/g.18818 Transcript_9027/m.18818 type:complete len:245 (+) Transcript_9027:20-754(+)
MAKCTSDRNCAQPVRIVSAVMPYGWSSKPLEARRIKGYRAPRPRGSAREQLAVLLPLLLPLDALLLQLLVRRLRVAERRAARREQRGLLCDGRQRSVGALGGGRVGTHPVRAVVLQLHDQSVGHYPLLLYVLLDVVQLDLRVIVHEWQDERRREALSPDALCAERGDGALEVVVRGGRPEEGGGAAHAEARGDAPHRPARRLQVHLPGEAVERVRRGDRAAEAARGRRDLLRAGERVAQAAGVE